MLTGRDVDRTLSTGRDVDRTMLTGLMLTGREPCIEHSKASQRWGITDLIKILEKMCNLLFCTILSYPVIANEISP